MIINKNLIPSLLLIPLLVADRGVFAQEDSSQQQILENFGVNATEIQKLERGEIITFEVSETSKKELAIGIAMILPVAVPKVIEYIKFTNLMAIEPDMQASGPLGKNDDENSLRKFAFTPKQIDEAKAFLKAGPGEEFNLSKPELDNLISSEESLKSADNKSLLTAANQKYRELLLERFHAYRKNGLTGISTYQRENTAANPAAELRIDANNSKIWGKYFPELQQVWLNYPAALPANASAQFLWVNHKTEDRPTAILTHRVTLTNKLGGIVLSRQFYVGHSYNSSQVVAGGLPYKDGVLFFYSTRLSTDQVAGMGSSLRHEIGREQMKSEMITRLKRINKDLKLKAALVASKD